MAGVIIVLWVLASGKAKSQSVAASHQTPGNPESYSQETSSEPDMSRMMQMQMTGMNQNVMNGKSTRDFLGRDPISQYVRYERGTELDAHIDADDLERQVEAHVSW